MLLVWRSLLRRGTGGPWGLGGGSVREQQGPEPERSGLRGEGAWGACVAGIRSCPVPRALTEAWEASGRIALRYQATLPV